MRILKSIGVLLVLVFMARSAGAELPPLVLEKTVGTNESVCATAAAITVTAGTEVTYCYQVTNNSGITLSTHDLFDDKLGPLLTSYSYTLPPGASTSVTATATITTTTVNVATWTASDTIIITRTAETADGGAAGWGPAPVTSFTASDSCIVNVAVLPTEIADGPDGCTDGVDNDQDGRFDCGDSDCVGVGPCAAPAPVLGPGGMVVAGLVLISVGAGALLRRRS